MQVQNLECSPMHDVKYTPRLQCAIPSSSMLTMINVDSRIDITDHNMDHITYLERSLCSNFFCCGVQLADFHALLEHFEENHVVVLAPNGKRVYPREGLRAVPLDSASGSSTPSSSRASSVSPSSPLTPQTPLSPLLSAISPPVSRKSSFTVPPIYTPFTPSLPVDPADPLLDSSEIVMSQEPHFDFSVQPSFFPPLPSSELTPEPSSSEDEGTPRNRDRASSTDHEMSARSLHVRFLTTSGGGKRKTDKHLSKSGKSRRHHPSGSHSKRREKMYRCPKNGCVKAYLNPNGLKYHLEKGTCKFAEDDDDAILNDRSDLPKLSPPASPSTPHSAPVIDSQSAVNTPKFEERSPANTTINDSDPSQEGVSQPLSHANAAFQAIGPSSNSNYGHHSVVMNPSWGTTPRIENPGPPHPYSHPTEMPTPQHFNREEQDQYSSSTPAPSVPPQSCPLPMQGLPVPQYMNQLSQQQQIQFHYPVPTYPNGYIYAQQQQHRYFAAERATYELPASLLANGGVAQPSSSQ